MGRITSLQNQVGHLQETLAKKNRLIEELQGEIRALKETIDSLKAKLQKVTDEQDAKRAADSPG